MYQRREGQNRWMGTMEGVPGRGANGVEEVVGRFVMGLVGDP